MARRVFPSPATQATAAPAGGAKAPLYGTYLGRKDAAAATARLLAPMVGGPREGVGCQSPGEL